MADAHAQEPADAAPLMPHLSNCTQLTVVILLCFSFTEADLKALVAAVPRMQKCMFYRSVLPSLAPLAGARQLRQLDIFESHFHVAGLPPLAAIASLRILRVDLPLEEHAEARALLRSAPFAHLEKFEVSGPEVEEEGEEGTSEEEEEEEENEAAE